MLSARGIGVGVVSAVVWACCAAPASAELYGLSVGIDRYALEDGKFDLEGAVNDAEDIAATLRRAGASEVVLLANDRATKAAIQQTWFRLIDRAKAGDTIVLTYAGHGSQEPAPAGAADEPDGLNENFILGGFLPTGVAAKERIVDDEMNLWLKRADDKGLRVVFIADACHSGSMTRALSASAEARLRFRNMPRSSPPLDGFDFPPPAIAKLAPDDFRNVTFVAAVQEDKKSPEVTIEGKPRGALSYAFARGVEGAADANGDGLISQDELLAYLKLSINKLVESQQTPEVRPLRSADRPVLPAIRAASRPAPAGPVLRIAAIGGSVSIGLPGIEVVSDPAKADLVWNSADGTVQHRVGGVVAEKVDAGLLRAVAAKWLALEVLKSASAEAAAAEITTGNEIHKRGQAVGLSVKGASRPFLTVFNLPPSGRVELLVPQPGQEKFDWRGREIKEQFRVADPPFGAEHIVAILSDEPLLELQSKLNTLRSPEQMVALPALLQAALGNRKAAIGIAPLYTSGERCSRAADGPRCLLAAGE